VAGLDPAIHAFQAANLGPQRFKINAAWYEKEKKAVTFLKKSNQKTFAPPCVATASLWPLNHHGNQTFSAPPPASLSAKNPATSETSSLRATIHSR